MRPEFQKFKKLVEEQIDKERGVHGYPKNQESMIKKFLASAEAKIKEGKITNGHELYLFYQDGWSYPAFSITGRITVNFAFDKMYGHDVVMAWRQPLYEQSVKSFNQALGQALRR